MSVNEVKLSKAATPLEIRGTGPPTSRTFCIGDEDHTLGNALRHILMQNAKVNFCGYSVPHPSEPVVQIRIQTNGAAADPSSYTASTALREGCQTLYDQCDVLLQKLEEMLPEVREDREKLEKIMLEEGYMDDDDEEEGAGDGGDDQQQEEEEGDFHDDEAMDMH